MTAAPLTPALERRMRDQLAKWRQDLMSIDKRQRLVYFKHTRSTSLELEPADVDDMLLLLDDQRIVFRPNDEERDRPPARYDVLAANKTTKELTPALRRLDQQARQVFADRGFWPLQLGVGMLRWRDRDDDVAIDSPLALVPVELRRDAASLPYYLVRADDDPVLNPALRLKLERDYGVDLPEVDEFPFSAAKLLLEASAAVSSQPQWSVSPRLVLTLFSFHKEAIYRDLQENEELIAGHPLTQLVALGPAAPSAADFAFDPADDEDIDEVAPPEQLASILDADGSQRRCVLAAKDGRSFVMDGPPGTGKSQTIANVIAELIAAGRSVLFVSEKMAALDVVRDRLTAAGLGTYLMELHSHAATRKAVADELNATLRQVARLNDERDPVEESQLVQARRDLSAYAVAVNEVRSGLGRSVHQVVGRLEELRRHERFMLDPDLRWGMLTAGQLAEIKTTGAALARAWRPVSDGDDFLWREVFLDAGAPDGRALAQAAARAASAASDLHRAATSVARELRLPVPVSVDDARGIDRVARLVAARVHVPESWLTAPDLVRVQERLGVLEGLVGQHLRQQEELAAKVGPRWTELDAERFAAVRDAGPDWVSHTMTLPASQLAIMADFLRGTPARLADVVEPARRLAAAFGFPSDRLSSGVVRRLTALAALSERPERPLPQWLAPGAEHVVGPTLERLREAVGQVRSRRAALTPVFRMEALGADLPALAHRVLKVNTGLRRLSGESRADRRALASMAVSGKVDDVVLAALPDAVTWQAQERALVDAERECAATLGPWYRGVDTDFDAAVRALGLAVEAVRLAGFELDVRALTSQLSTAALPQHPLAELGRHVDHLLGSWAREASYWLPARQGALESAALLDVAEECLSVAAELAPRQQSVEHAATVAGRDLTGAEAVDCLRLADAVSASSVVLLDAYERDQQLLGIGYDGVTTDWPALHRAVEWVTELRAALGGPTREATAQALVTAVVDGALVADRLPAWDVCRSALTAAFDASRRDELSGDLDDDLEQATGWCQDLASAAVDDIDEWRRFRAAQDRLSAGGLGPVVDELVAQAVPAGDVEEALEWACLYAWVEAAAEGDPRLGQWRAGERDSLVGTFQRLDQRLVRHGAVRVVEAVNRRRPRSMGSTAAATIQREAVKQRRHKPIRQLLDETWDLVALLKPCFMMSPLSVSQYLPPTVRFDVVIFDEASQVLPSDAVNCLYRADQAIIAGDAKQLPPTQFFARAIDDDADEDDEDALDVFQSVLDQCKAAGALPSLPLTWHYRSRHEALITYSNYKFYSGDLNTFPGAHHEAPDLGVAAYVVEDGVYERGGSRSNPREAQAVVDRVLHHALTTPGRSIGVVTFSSAQEDAIQAALERRSADEPALAALLDGDDRLNGFFVKALENVQGDERDVIVISVGYGPDEYGKLTLNFGPLNRSGGWRRLNVAVTRARRRVEIVSSFPAGRLPDSENEGVRHLARYLDFAARGMPALGLELGTEDRDTESPFEEDVLRVIRGWGYDVVPQVGAAGYRIDLGVRHPELPGRYALAVECDGATYHSAKVARDRDRLREEVLRGLGWQVHRIWSLSWLRDRERQVARLRAAIESAVAGEAAALPVAHTSQHAEVVLEEFEVGETPDWAEPYVVTPIQRMTAMYELHTWEARPQLRSFLASVLEAEAPIHQALLFDRLRAATGVGRIGSRIRTNVESVLREMDLRGARVVQDDDGFFRVTGRERNRVRLPDDEATTRPVAQVPPEELERAVYAVVADNVFMSAENLRTTTARLFRWRRAGADIQDAIDDAVDRLLRNELLVWTPSGELRVKD